MDRDLPVQSPCTSVCQLDAVSGYCLGCWRSGDEIAGWSRFDDQQKHSILALLHARREQAGGRRRRLTARRARGK